MVFPGEMLHRASEPGWESQEGPVGVLLSSPSYPAAGLLMGNLEDGTAPLREVGMLEPEGSVICLRAVRFESKSAESS